MTRAYLCLSTQQHHLSYNRPRLLLSGNLPMSSPHCRYILSNLLAPRASHLHLDLHHVRRRGTGAASHRWRPSTQREWQYRRRHHDSRSLMAGGKHVRLQRAGSGLCMEMQK